MSYAITSYDLNMNFLDMPPISLSSRRYPNFGAKSRRSKRPSIDISIYQPNEKALVSTINIVIADLENQWNYIIDREKELDEMESTDNSFIIQPKLSYSVTANIISKEVGKIDFSMLEDYVDMFD